MTYTPPAHAPSQWRDYPNTSTPITAANLEAAEQDLVAYTQTVGTQLGTYVDGQVSSVPVGPTGPPATFRGAYGAGTTYSSGDEVSFASGGSTSTYVSLVNSNTGNQPDTHPSQWGLAASAGATGSGAVFQSVDALSVTPRSVTDWGALLNTALAAGISRFVFGPYAYPYTTAMALPVGTVFEGTVGWDWTVRTTAPFTRLVWNGTGSGHAISCHAASSGNLSDPTAITMRDIQFQYSSASYTGTMIEAGYNGGFARFEGCYFGPAGTGQPVMNLATAKAAVGLDDMNTIEFHNCTFAGDSFNSGACRGREPAAGGYSNVAVWRDCTFGGRALTNPGLDYLFDHCVFEVGNNTGWGLPVGGAVISQDFTYAIGDPNAILTLRDCAYWDGPGDANQAVIRQPASSIWDLTIRDCAEHLTGNLIRLYDLQGNGTVKISGGNTGNEIYFGNASVAGQKKEIIWVEGLAVTAMASEQLTGLDGHDDVTVLGARHGPNYDGHVRNGLITISDQVESRIETAAHLPTIAPHAGISNITCVVLGNDHTGIVTINNTSGSPSATGLLVDVAFRYPRVLKGPTNDYGFVLVELSPYAAASNVTNPNSGPVSHTVQAYGYAVGGTMSGFSIGVGVAIPGSATIQYVYRVTLLNGLA